MEISKKIKLLSVNECWRGKLCKTKAYEVYERELIYTLPKMELPKAPYKVKFKFGFSSKSSDIDNPLKPLIDIMEKKYGFNDKEIYKLEVEKEMVKKGETFIN